MYKSIFHRDGTVTFWNVYTQVWQRRKVEAISNDVMASFMPEERKRIERHSKRHA